MRDEITRELRHFALNVGSLKVLDSTKYILDVFAQRLRGIEVKSRVTPYDFDVMDLEGRMELCEPIPTELLPLQLALDDAKAKREGWLKGFADFREALLKEVTDESPKS